MEIHERIQTVRKANKMSRREFGEVLGVSEDMIANIELNRLKRPDQKEPLYRLIYEKFGVNEIWLKTGDGEMFQEMTDHEELAAFFGSLLKTGSDDFRYRFASAMAKLDEKEWLVIEKIIENMTKEKMEGN